jgi:exopolysaccharide production protein ExoQ
VNSRDHSFLGIRTIRFPPSWTTTAFLAVAFLFAECNYTFSRFIAEGYSPAENELMPPSYGRRLAFLALALFSAISLYRQQGTRFRTNGWLGYIALGFIGWTMLSVLWAEDLGQTVARLVTFAIFCAAATVVARRFTSRDVILLTVIVSGIILAAGVFAEINLGTFRPFTPGYRFAGVIHPNNEGINCALLLLSGITATRCMKRYRIPFYLCAFSGLVFLILTGSRTAAAAAIVATVTYLFTNSSSRGRIALVVGGPALLSTLLLSAGPKTLKSSVLLGREPSGVNSLSGRTELWAELAEYAAQRPILGYGYGGFWTPAHKLAISSQEKWAVPDSHSTYLEVLLTLGTLGMLTYALLLLMGIRRAFRFYGLTHDPAFACMAAMLLFASIDGLLEAAFTEPALPMFLSMVMLAQLGFARVSPAQEDQR